MTADSVATSSNSRDAPTAFRQTNSDISTTSQAADTLRASSFEGGRPALAQHWQTDRPQPTTASSLLSPHLTRRATNVSILNEAIWNTQDSDNSSTSSVSDEENSLGAKKSFLDTQGRQKGNTDSYSKFNVGNEGFKTKGRVSKRDGRLNISVNETNNRGYLAKALGATFHNHLGPNVSDQMPGLDASNSRVDADNISHASSDCTVTSSIPRPRLNIVVMVIGSRGDIQPFLKLGKNLKEYGHRVRIATHPAFRDFVEKDSGLEFFSVGGDPAELMAFMVKNPGMIPTMDTLKKGEVGRRRDQMAQMFEGFWRACINATDQEKDVTNLKMMGDKSPFIADAIIANPPSFAHIHCAERLGIPLHLMFTFPYTPTQAFPHPLANIKKTNVDPGYANFMSYPLVEMMTWQGLGDLVNAFRVKTLGLEPVSTLWAPGQLYRLKVPYTYLWSPGLVPKPKDWGPEIDIAGFVFLDLASSFKPPAELVKFLGAGDSPVYIGFGSIVVDDPEKFTKMIFEAIKRAGVRALVSKGWGGFGDDNPPENVYMLENTPHDWLFPKVAACVHHGGAGTTAISLKCGKPTMIVPFFGDQQFWGAMIGDSGAGAKPVPYKSLTAEKLADGITQCLTDGAREAAQKIAQQIEAEGDGAKNAVTSFHRSLCLRGLNSMRCSILETYTTLREFPKLNTDRDRQFEDRVAVWTLKNTNLRLSALAAELLVERKKISWKQLRLIRHNEWNDFEGPGEPLTGGATAIMGTVTGIAAGVGSVPFKIAKNSKRRFRHERKNRRQPKQLNGKRSRSVSSSNGKSNTRHPNEVDREPRSYSKTEDWQDGEAEQIPDSKAPEKACGKATWTVDMGKHTSKGEPMGQMQDANREEESHANEEDSGLSHDFEDNAAEALAQDLASGLGRTAEALARAPMDLALAVAQGFHNAPRLYGDSTVRRPTRITGIKSGLKAAGEEFIFGIYDGVGGLFVQPYTGARDNGPVGFVKGVGMGLTGFVLKDLAAIFGPFGYTLKGVHKELLKGRQPTNFIRKARILQGQRDLRCCDENERKAVQKTVSHGWSVVQQVWSIMEDKRAQGLKGRAQAMKERKTWRLNGAFENVTMAEKALAARERGESLDAVFAQQREQLEKAKKPRKNVAKNIQQGRLGENDG